MQYRTIDRQRDSSIERRRRRQVQIDVYNIDQQIDREIVRQRGGGGRYRQMQQIDREIVRQRGGGVGRYRQMCTTQINRQIERQFDREEEEKVGTDREIIEQREVGGGRHRQMCTTQSNRQRDSSIEKRRRQIQIDVYNIEQQIDRYRGGGRLKIDVYNREQQIDREIVRQRAGGGRYRQMCTTQNNRQIERQFDREEVGTDIDVYNIEQQIERDSNIE